jgi:hypothetical protein
MASEILQWPIEGSPFQANSRGDGTFSLASSRDECAVFFTA